VPRDVSIAALQVMVLPEMSWKLPSRINLAAFYPNWDLSTVSVIDRDQRTIERSRRKSTKQRCPN